MKKTMQKLENLTTIRRRWSQLEVKLFTEKLKNEGTGSIRLKIASLRSFFFSSHQSPLFPLFIGQRRKRQVLKNEEKHFLWRHSLLDPTSVTEVHIAFCHPLRHQFIGQHFLVNRISSWSQSSIDTQLEHFALKNQTQPSALKPPMPSPTEKEEEDPTRPKHPYSSTFFETRLDLARRGFVPPPFNPDLNRYHGLELAIRRILTQVASIPPTALSILPQPDANAIFLLQLQDIIVHLFLIGRFNIEFPASTAAIYHKVLLSIFNHLLFLHINRWL